MPIGTIGVITHIGEAADSEMLVDKRKMIEVTVEINPALLPPDPEFNPTYAPVGIRYDPEQLEIVT